MPKPLVGSLHLFLIEDCLPVGMAIVERVKTGGVSKVIEDLSSVDNPIDTFKMEGTSSAMRTRERLDQFSPGLGNPAVDVEVFTNDNDPQEVNSSEINTLLNLLERIDNRLEEIKKHIDK